MRNWVFCLVFLSLSACAPLEYRAPVVPQQPTATPSDLQISQTERGVLIQSSEKILFDTGKADLKPAAKQFLDDVATILRTKSSSHVLIEGHTDNVGNARMNKELSELRALRVMKALIDRGVPKSRMQALGFGMSRPIASNATAAGRAKNRRTDIILLGEKQENLRR